jgi:hypothetical protein
MQGGFDVGHDIEKIHKACKGIGTDEKVFSPFFFLVSFFFFHRCHSEQALIGVICNRPKDYLLFLRQEYHKHHKVCDITLFIFCVCYLLSIYTGGSDQAMRERWHNGEMVLKFDLIFLLEELSGNLERTIVAALSTDAENRARFLHDAVQGAGTNEHALIDCLCTALPSQIHAIKEVPREQKCCCSIDLVFVRRCTSTDTVKSLRTSSRVRMKSRRLCFVNVFFFFFLEQPRRAGIFWTF